MQMMIDQNPVHSRIQGIAKGGYPHETKAIPPCKFAFPGN
jgi:hypothetical protein